MGASRQTLQADGATARSKKERKEKFMTQASIGQGGQRDSNENVPQKGEEPKKTFGEEGTNKTQSEPDPNAKPSDVGGGKFIAPTPFTR
jgi:hypothetical protein